MSNYFHLEGARAVIIQPAAHRFPGLLLHAAQGFRGLHF